MGMVVRVGDVEMKARYSVEDVVRSYVWMGYRGFTELNGFHPDYQPGKENFGWNLKHGTLPRVWYAKNPDDAVRFVEKYCDSRMVCYGLNPRSKMFKNDRGYARSAFEREIQLVQNILFDFDFENHSVSNNLRKAFGDFLTKRAEVYFQDFGLNPPTSAYTGRGYHFLFAVPAIEVKQHPDIGARLKEFRNRFERSFRRELSDLGARLDATQDLRRMVRIYGTAKPKLGILSEFYGGERVEDERLVDYLMDFEVSQEVTASKGSGAVLELKVSRDLPAWFGRLLDTNAEVQALWRGEGKPEGTDTSGSGFDYSLTRKLLSLGYHNFDELATVLVVRPGGSVQTNGKGDSYVRRTIANALIR